METSDMTPKSTAQERILEAIDIWLGNLKSYPAWKDWKRSQLAYTLNFDDEFEPSGQLESDFAFSPQIEGSYAVVSTYLELLTTAHALKDVEWCFRRYPRSPTSVTRANHLRYCCEIYFGRFYQFRERLKKLSNAVKLSAPNNNLDFGALINNFDKKFDQEVRSRNSIHHHHEFDDIEISRIFLLELRHRSAAKSPFPPDCQIHYRRVAKNWVSRVRRRSIDLDRFVEAVAEALLGNCNFMIE